VLLVASRIAMRPSLSSHTTSYSSEAAAIACSASRPSGLLGSKKLAGCLPPNATRRFSPTLKTRVA
jgi:hypothetical protein